MTLPQKYIWPFDALYHLDDYIRTLDKSDSGGFPKWEQWVEGENNSKLVIQFLIAGYPRECINVSAQADRLTISADKAPKHALSRFAGRSFKQTLQDAHGCWDFTRADVEYKDGILRLEVPLREEAQTKALVIR
jgi:HSP20 family molecular chaperone IbpA